MSQDQDIGRINIEMVPTDDAGSMVYEAACLLHDKYSEFVRSPAAHADPLGPTRESNLPRCGPEPEIVRLRKRAEAAERALTEIMRTEQLGPGMQLVVYGANARDYAIAALSDLDAPAIAGEGVSS